MHTFLLLQADRNGLVIQRLLVNMAVSMKIRMSVLRAEKGWSQAELALPVRQVYALPLHCSLLQPCQRLKAKASSEVQVTPRVHWEKGQLVPKASHQGNSMCSLILSLVKSTFPNDAGMTEALAQRTFA